MRPFYHSFLFFVVLLGCTDSELRSSYAISRTQWRGQSPEGPIVLEFDFINVAIGYGGTSYTRSVPYSYSSKNYQGSIFIDNFPFDTGENLDVTWLFSISDDTESMKLLLFRKLDENRLTITLERQD